jgi:hypothetical protein
MSQENQLIVPNVATRDPQSFEILRVWIAEKNQHVSLRSGVWEDPAAWGLMLADLARHIANTYGQRSDGKHAETLRRIREAFNVELDD